MRRSPRAAAAAVAAMLVVVALGWVLPAPVAADPQPPVPEPSPAESRETADRILDQDKYHEPGTNRSFLDRIREWIDDRLPDGDRDLGINVPDGLSLVLLVAIGVAAIALITLLVTRMRGRRRRVADKQPEGDVEVTALLSVDEWEAEERRLEAAGDHRGAVRARYRATVGLLADRDVVRDVPGRTPAEFAHEVEATAPGAALAFAGLADLVNRIWFGRQPAGPEDLAEARSSASEVRDRTRRRERPADLVDVAVAAGEQP